jgi:tripartite ATP-independent transporter DctP family solute receptor
MKEKKTIWLALECVILFGTLIAICGSVAGHRKRKNEQAQIIVPEYVLTYAENQAADYPTSRGAEYFAELVKERTDGRIEILVYAGGTLGDEKSVIEQMQFGGIDFARVSLSPLASVAPRLNVLQLPYLYTGSDHMWKVLDGPIGEQFMNSFNGTGLTALSWYDAGARNFYCTKQPIRTLEDVKGMRIRVQESDLMKDMIEALGGTAVPTSYDTVYSALQTGAIDGAENNWPSYESEKHYEVARYYTVDEHARVPEMQLASQVTWDKLSEEDQRLIRECARESAVYERALWAQREAESEKKVREAGCVVYEMPEEERERFRKAMLPVYEKYCADDMDMIEAIEEEGKKMTDSW